MGYIKNIIFLILFSSCFQPLIGQEDSLRAPVNFQMKLAGNFGELRSGHFHAGIDIKTYGMKGKKIHAIADGYISRIKVSEGGYGKALYVHHPKEGITSVFGHLEQFSEEVDEYVLKNQYEKKQYEIQLFPDSNQFPVKKGNVIAFSGNSGRSQGPHIHFEIRNINNQHPLNPLQYNFNIKDNIPPKIFDLAVYSHSAKQPKQQKDIYEVEAVSGDSYRLLNRDTLYLNGPHSFGIRTFDFLNGAKNWCGIYDLKLLVDSTLIYHHKLDEFAFSETRYINSFIDFEEKIKNDLSIQKTHLQPNNKLDIYNYVKGKGIFSFDDRKTHELQYIVKDAYGNKADLSFFVKNDTSRVQKNTSDSDSVSYKKTMPFNKTNNFSTEYINLQFPANSFYDTLYFNYNKKKTSNQLFFSDIHQIHNKYTPVHKPFSLTIKTKKINNHLTNKAFIAKIEEEGEYEYKGGEYLNGSVITNIREFGEYVVMVDTIAPKIELISSPDNIKNQKSIKLRVTDNLSEIKTYNGYIDGEWVLFEYDPKNDLLIHKFETHQLKSDSEHELELYVGDNKNNISTFYTKFEK
ncbi:MAG: M23 family metallopeptidase [Bacteroidota bacterium]